MKFALTIMALIAVAHPAHAQNCQQLADQAYWAAVGQASAPRIGFSGTTPAAAGAQAEIAVLTACRAGQPANPYVPIQQPRQPFMCTMLGNWLYCQ